MATYYVATNGSNSNAGTSGAPWATFAYAAANSAANDTIRIKAGTYNEILRVTKNGQTWMADDDGNNKANWPVISGNYGPEWFNTAGGRLTLPTPGTLGDAVRPKWPTATTGQYDGLVTMANGVTGTTFKWLKVMNSAGAAFKVTPSNHNTTIDGCIVDFTYAGSIQAGGERGTILQNFTIKNSTVTRSSIKAYDPNRPSEGGGPAAVDTTIKPQVSTGAKVQNNLLAFCYGEGIGASRGAQDILIEDNVVHNTDHWALGVNCAKDVVMRNNRVYVDGTLPDILNGTAGIRLGDEGSSLEKTLTIFGYRFYSERVAIYNNVAVGFRYAFELTGTGNYRTWVDKAYIGYNTFIGGAKAVADKPTAVVRLTDGATLTGASQPHRSVLFENNALVRGQADALIVRSGTLTNYAFRNNAFSESQSLIGGTGNVTGATVASRMVNANGPRSAAGYTPNMTNAELATLLTRLETDTRAFNPVNYHLTGGSESERSPLIGAGSVHTALNGITPAVGPNTGQVNEDYTGGARSDLDAGAGKYYDIGFFELGSTSVGVTPSFTQTDPTSGNPITSGKVPVTVRFTDTSTTSGGVTIQERLWKFDGASDAPPVPSSGTTIDYTYREAGTYTPVLTIRSSEDSGTKRYTKSGTAMTFTGGTVDGVYIDTVSVAIGTETGVKDFTFNLGNNVPQLVVFTMTAATSTSAVADGALLSHGFASSGTSVTQYGVAIFSKDNVASTSTGRYQSGTACLLSVSEGGTITGSAYVAQNGFAPDKVTLTITDAFPASYLVTATAYGGSGITAKAGLGIGPASSVDQVSVPVGFQPSLFCLVTNNRAMEVASTTAAASFGYATAVNNQYYVRWHEGEAKDTALPEVNAGAGIAYRSTNDEQVAMRIAAFSPTGVTLAADAAYQVGFGWYAIRTTLGIDMRLLQVAVPTPTTGSNQDVTLGWQPGHMQSITTNLTMPVSPATWKVTDTTAAASHIGLHVNRDADGSIPAFERTNLPGIRHGDGAGVTHTTSRILNNVMGVRRSYTRNNVDDIDTELEAAVSFLSTGYRLAWTTKTVSDRVWLVIAMQTGAASTPSGPIVSFHVTDAAGTSPAVGLEPFTAYLTDTSDDNGESIDSWAIDWGDGVTETKTTRPTSLTHVYNDAGTYSVALTATNNNGSTTRTLADAVVVKAPPGDQIIGPLRPGTITENTDNEVVLDINDSRRGFITHKLELGALKISNAYPAFTVDSGHWQVAVVDNKLKVMGSNGAIGEINITWDDTAPPPPPPSSGTVTAQIRTGNDDGDEAVSSSPGNGVVDLVDPLQVRINQAGHWGALRFANTSGTGIPKGANVTSAKLSVYLNSADNDSPNVTIKAHDVANAPVLGTDAFSISALWSSATSASATWNASNLALGWQDSPSLVSVIQEIVTSYGWPANEHITLILDAETGCALTFRPFEYDAQLAAKLTVTYTT